MSYIFERTKSGTFQVRLGNEARELIAWVMVGVKELLTEAGEDGDPALNRLFPHAYSPDEPEKNAEYARLMKEDLRASHLGALEILSSTLTFEELDEEQMLAWMGALNQVRLFLGTRLEVTEDMDELAEDDPRSPAYDVYRFMSFLQEDLIDALQEP